MSERQARAATGGAAADGAPTDEGTGDEAVDRDRQRGEFRALDEASVDQINLRSRRIGLLSMVHLRGHGMRGSPPRDISAPASG